MLTHINSAKKIPCPAYHDPLLLDFLAFLDARKDSSGRPPLDAEGKAKIRFILNAASAIRPFPSLATQGDMGALQGYLAHVSDFFAFQYGLQPPAESSTYDILIQSGDARPPCTNKLRPNGWLVCQRSASATACPADFYPSTHLYDWCILRRQLSLTDFDGRIHVIVPVHNRAALTRRCLDSLMVQTLRDRIHIVVVDDGSSDDTAEMLATHFPEASRIAGDGTLWWAGGINAGLNHVRPLLGPDDFILWVNNDVALQPETLEILVRHALMDRAACWAPAGLADGEAIGSGERGHVPYRFEQIEAYFSRQNRILAVECLFGRCSLFSKDLLDDLPMLDSDTFPHYWSDSDYFYRAAALGYSSYITGATYISVIHDASNTGSHLGFFDKGRTLREIVHHLTDLKSLGNVKYAWRFATRHRRKRRWKMAVKLIVEALANHVWLRRS